MTKPRFTQQLPVVMYARRNATLCLWQKKSKDAKLFTPLAILKQAKIDNHNSSFRSNYLVRLCCECCDCHELIFRGLRRVDLCEILNSILNSGKIYCRQRNIQIKKGAIIRTRQDFN